MFEAAILIIRSTVGKIVIASFFAFSAGAGASMWAVGIYYKSEIAELKVDKAETHDANSTAALREFQAIAGKITKAAGDYGKEQNEMRLSFDAIVKDLRNVKFKVPLAPDCKPDDGRLQSLNASVAAANRITGIR